MPFKKKQNNKQNQHFLLSVQSSMSSQDSSWVKTRHTMEMAAYSDSADCGKHSHPTDCMMSSRAMEMAAHPGHADYDKRRNSTDCAMSNHTMEVMA